MFISILHQPWHWAFSGVMIVIVMFLLLYAGRRFGVSTSFDALCSLAGAGKRVPYFRENWKTHAWLLVFLLGTVLGSVIATVWMQSPEPVNISQNTRDDLAELGVMAPATLAEGKGYVPEEIFNFENLLTVRGFILMIVGGFIIGFGTRWAGGCTSGHAISGLSNLQLPSLVAVIGFFIGGLLMTHLLLPIILRL